MPPAVGSSTGGRGPPREGVLGGLPPGVVAAIGRRLGARDRAALARASRAFGAAHDAVAEEDAWPPGRSAVSDAEPATAEEVAAARARVALLVRAMPMLRTLRVFSGQHEEARAFVELGGGRVARFACIYCWRRCTSAAAEVARAFPGRVGARVVYVHCSGDAAATAATAALIGALESVEVVDISPLGRGAAAPDRSALEPMDANARAHVDALPPWSRAHEHEHEHGSTGVLRISFSAYSAEDAAALLALVPARVRLGLRTRAHELADGLPALLAAVRERGPDAERGLGRVERLHVDSQMMLESAVPEICRAMPAIARLPPGCALSVSASLCCHAQSVPLLRHALAPAPYGGRRARVEVVCGGGAGDDALFVFARRDPAPPETSAYVQAAVACLRDGQPAGCSAVAAVDGLARNLHTPDPDWPTALARLRTDPLTAGTAALWAGV